jgi:NAD(P)-dependent dehydrogenase (short-subunit alcohol dehydrogenase family)
VISRYDRVSRPVAAAAVSGLVLGMVGLAGAALLIVPGPGSLPATGLVAFVLLLATAAGVWVGVRERRAPPWVAAVLALAAAAYFAHLWEAAPGLRGSGAGRALGLLLFVAEPGYLLGAGLAASAASAGTARRAVAAAAGVAGSGAGVLLAAAYLVPRLPPAALFMGAAALVAAAGWSQARDAGPERRGDGVRDRTIIVTGVGGQGQLGYFIAETLLARGAHVVIADLSPAVADHAAALGAERVAAVAADLATEEGAGRVVEAAIARFGGVDGLVNAAGGLSVTRPLADTDADAWAREQLRNATTAHVVSRAALPALRQRRGAIVNFASPVVLRGSGAGLGAYAAAKAGVVALTRALAVEERETGVRVNAVAPGMVDTEQNRAEADDPAGVKWVTRAQVADVVAFLLSDAASGVNGEVVHVLGEGVA